MAQAVGISGIMLVMRKYPCLSIKFIQSTAPGANPEIACAVLINCLNSIVAQAVRVIGVVQIMSKLPGFTIEFV